MQPHNAVPLSRQSLCLYAIQVYLSEFQSLKLSKYDVFYKNSESRAPNPIRLYQLHTLLPYNWLQKCYPSFNWNTKCDIHQKLTTKEQPIFICTQCIWYPKSYFPYEQNVQRTAKFRKQAAAFKTFWWGSETSEEGERRSNKQVGVSKSARHKVS